MRPILNTAVCQCGGKKGKHFIGEQGCYRETIIPPPRRLSCEEDRWVVDGEVLTGTSLRQQRGYSEHEVGIWSRPKEGYSNNSLDTC